MQYSALAQINKANVAGARAGLVLSGAGRSRASRLQPAHRRRRDVRRRGEGRRRRARRRDRAKSCGRRPKQATERGLTYWESADRSDRRLILTREQRHSRDRCANRPVDHHVRQQRLRRHAHRQSAPPRRAEQQSRARLREPPHRRIERRRRIRIAAGRRPRLRRDHRKAGLDVSHDPAARRIRLRNLAARLRRSYAGGANTWGDITLDRKNGIVFLPTGSPTHDLYGADRAGNNLFGNCLLALDARTGERLWHFQTVHHDLWDYDLTAAPKLLTVRHDGRLVDIVAQAGKTGFLYVFERKTGTPLWPIEERPVPKSEVPGEVSSPTQPIPDEAAAVRASGVQARRRQPVHERGGTGEAAASGARRGQRGRVHAVESPALSHSVSGRVGRRQLGQHRRAIRRPACSTCAASRCRAIAGCRSDSRRSRRRFTGGAARAGRLRRLHAALRGVSRPGPDADAIAGAAGRRTTFRTLLRQGREQMPAFPETTLPAGDASTRSKRICSALPVDGRAERRRPIAAAAAESEPLPGSRDALRRIVLGRAGTRVTGFRPSGRRGRSWSPTISTRAPSSGVCRMATRPDLPRRAS